MVTWMSFTHACVINGVAWDTVWVFPGLRCALMVSNTCMWWGCINSPQAMLTPASKRIKSHRHGCLQAINWLQQLSLQHMTHLQLTFSPMRVAELLCLAQCLHDARQMREVKLAAHHGEPLSGLAEGVLAMPCRGEYAFRNAANVNAATEAAARTALDGLAQTLQQHGAAVLDCTASLLSFKYPPRGDEGCMPPQIS